MNAAKSQTAKALGVDVSKLSYIDDALLEDFKRNAKPVDKTTGNADGVHLQGWGTYGNTITYSGDLVYWKQGPKGSANYGCGTSESWYAGKLVASHINPKGACPGGKEWYFLGDYNG